MEIQLPFKHFISLKDFSEILILLRPTFTIAIKRYEAVEKVMHYEVSEFWTSQIYFRLFLMDCYCQRELLKTQNGN